MEFYAKDIMSQKLITVKPTMMCEEAMTLFTANHISGAPVVSATGELIGVISLYDLVNAGITLPYSESFFEEARIDRMLSQEGFHVESISEGTVSDYMTRDVFTATPETPVSTLAREMYTHKVHRVIIVDPNTRKPVGLVSTFDLLKLLAEAEDASQLRQQFAAANR
jgi:CBS domain-containing protein